MADIIERLYAVPETGADPELIEAAAAEIERLRAEIARREDGAERMALKGIEMRAEIQRLISERNAFGLAIDRALSGIVPDEHPLRSRLVEIAAMRAQTAPSVPDEWMDPNDKTQARYLPHIGEPVLFSHKGRVYYGKHTGGSFTAGAGACAQHFVTWDCMWRPMPAAPGAQENNDAPHQ